MEKLGWIRDALKARNYRAKDLAKAWGISEASTSRFIAGTEQQDPPLSRAVVLAKMLKISLEDLAKGMGHDGKPVPPTAPIDLAYIPSDTLNIQMIDKNTVRVTFCRDVAAGKISDLMKLLSN